MKKRISNIGIKWKLIIPFALLIAISGFMIGYSNYYNAERIVLQQIKDQLCTQAEDWKMITESYVEEINRANEMEDSIARVNLSSILESIERWFYIADLASGGKNKAPTHIKKILYKNISSLNLGKSTMAWIMKKHQDKLKIETITNKDVLPKQEIIDTIGKRFIKEIQRNTSSMAKEPSFIKYTLENENHNPKIRIAAVAYYKSWDVYLGIDAEYKIHPAIEQKMKERLKNKIARQVIGKTGYIYVISGTGKDKGHYIVSRNRQRDGENIWNEKDASDRYFIREIVREGKKTPSKAFTITYPWQNPGEEQAYKKIAAITYVPEWDWIIGASAYHKDFLDPLVLMRKRAMNITYISTIATIVIAFLIGSYYAKTLTVPLRKLTVMADKMGKGKLESIQPNTIHASAKEISTLVSALEKAKNTQEELERTKNEKSRLVEELEIKNTELERFTYTVSHDLRSPLVTIKGFLGVLTEDLNKQNLENASSYIKRISNASDKMQNLLTGLLELSRIGRVINPSENIDINRLVNTVLELLSGIINTRNVNIEVMHGMPHVYGDRQRLMEVFQNLIENSVKYFGGQENPKITIGYEKIENKTCFFVKDNGIGIDMKYKDKIFNLFDQLNHTSEGTGVGLALVKRIIEFHGGEIKVYSEGINKGAKFYFSLPTKNNIL